MKHLRNFASPFLIYGFNKLVMWSYFVCSTWKNPNFSFGIKTNKYSILKILIRNFNFKTILMKLPKNSYKYKFYSSIWKNSKICPPLFDKSKMLCPHMKSLLFGCSSPASRSHPSLPQLIIIYISNEAWWMSEIVLGKLDISKEQQDFFTHENEFSKIAQKRLLFMF